MSKRQKGEAALLSAAILYGLFGIFSRIISFHLPFFYQQWIRNLFAVVVIGILLFIFGKWKNIARNDLKWFLLRSTCGFISFIGIYIAFTKLDIGTTYFISYAGSTIGGYIVGKFAFNESINKIRFVSLLLSIIGLYFVYTVSFSSINILYIFLAFIAGLFVPGWNAFSKKISGTYSNLQLNFIDFIYATMIPFIISIVIREQWVMISFNLLWFETFLFAILFITVGLLIVYGFSHVDAQAGILILLFEVIAGIVFGYIFFKEIPPSKSLFGGILILLAIALRTGKLRFLFRSKNMVK